MKKIAIIVQRYGEEVSGGGEFYARALATHLKELYDVTVLTTTSLELTFEKYYEAGEYDDNGVRVIRFDNTRPRNFEVLENLSNDGINNLNAGNETRLGVDLQWADQWGPYCPNLVKYVEKSHDDYEAFIVFTYIYYTSIHCIPVVRDKAIFIPTAHDEIWARLTVFKKLFHLPRCIAYLTQGEKDFVSDFYQNDEVKSDIIGCGVDLPDDIDNLRFREKYKIDSDYIVYVGRIDNSKGCDVLVNYFLKYKQKYPSDLKLVLVGGGEIDCPKDKDVIFTGFVSEVEKFDCISGALLSVAPSEFESLCIAVLESMACSIPILVNCKCKILENHCQNGKNGLGFSTEKEFINNLHKLVSNKEMRDEMGKNAKQYLESNYTWDIVTSKIKSMVDYISANPQNEREWKNEVVEELQIRNVFMDKQFESDIIYANKKTRIEPCYENGVAVCLTSSDYFVPMCSVAVASIIRNAKSDRNYDILILTSGMSDKNKKRISELGKDNCSIRFVEFEDDLFSEKVTNHDSYNVYTYYRLMIPTICEKYKKVLYLDSDMVINRDVAEIYDTDIEGYYAAAVLDLTILTWQVMKERHPLYPYLESLNLTEPGTYMQGGVALYNTEMINSSYSVEDLIDKANERHYQNCDQELLNMCFKGKIKFLSQKWNVVVMPDAYIDLYEFWLPKKFYDLYIESRKDPYIIHYSFQQIPCYHTGYDMYEYFWKYARETAFYEDLLVMLISKQFSIGTVTQEASAVSMVKRKYPRILNKVFPKGTKRREFAKKVARKLKLG